MTDDALFPAAGEVGVVLGKRGEEGRVILVFPDEVLARLVPGDSIVVRGFGQGATLDGVPEVRLLNAAPDALDLLPVSVGGGVVESRVRAAVLSSLVGNGIGRPAELWDLDRR